MVEPTPSSIVARAAALGFDAVGFARADEPLERDHARYERFVDAGMHGEMGYLAEHREVRRRLDGEAMLAGAKTVVCLARRYDRDDEGLAPLAERIAGYARGRDYHTFLRKRLGKLAVELRAAGHEARALCDTAPVLERAWAARAGLGFVGKNGLLIIPGKGSYCLLGEVVTTLALPAEAYGQSMGERCGSCTACLDACPTDAFAEPFVLDARRCVSYWTIESRSLPPPELWEALGDHLFGCDRCQDVCPYNAMGPDETADTAPFAPHARWADVELETLARLDEQAWEGLSRGTPVRRATRRGLRRNAILVAAKRGAAVVGMEDDAELDAFARRVAEALAGSQDLGASE